MYEAHFGLTEKPFTLTPNPRFLFLSRTHQEALAHLRYGLENRVGFIAVSGEVGTGKTTILRTLFDGLDESRYRLALIFNPCQSALELLKCVNREFGLSARKRSLYGLLEELNVFLLEENRAGRTPLLVIDEAQNLPPEVLEQIRLLSNLETDRDKLIQIVLVGQPELDLLLERPDLRQLAQRISVRCRLVPLDREETRSYVQHRLLVAGVGGELFETAALSEVYRYTLGLPRLVNVLCDRALLAAFAAGHHRVTLADLREAADELEQGRRGEGGRSSDGKRKLLAGERFYWMLGAATVLEIAIMVWLVAVLT